MIKPRKNAAALRLARADSNTDIPDAASELTRAVQVDGRRVVIEAADEIVLCCGEASITLRRNGRVLIRGTHVETQAEGVNRIKGGSVQIN